MAKLREPSDTLAYEIKHIRLDEFDEVIESFDFKTKPREHQSRSLYLGLDQNTFLYALDMGLGKTLIGLYLTTIAKKLGEGSRTLVTCPPIVLRQWKKEAAKHSDLSVTIVDTRIKSKELKLAQLERYMSDITVVSHPWLVSLFNWAAKDPLLDKHLKKLFSGFDILIVDEAHVLRNPSTKGFKGYRKYFLSIKKRYLMTGTPIGNSYTGVWSLNFILDKATTFGTSYTRFLSKYFNAFNTGRYYKYTLKPEKREEFMHLFWNKTIRWEEAECNDLPGKTFTTLPVVMSAEQSKAYDALLSVDNEQGYENGQDPEFELMKVTAGIEIKESPKLEAIKELVKDICVENGRQFIIWCWLRDESDYLLEQLNKSFKKLRIEAIKGEGSLKRKDMILDDWEKGKVNVLIANQKSLGIGLDLYEASTCCFFSNNRSLIDRKQAEKRIHRTGQTKHCTYIDLVCERTIDEINLQIVMRAKESFTELTKDDTDFMMLLRKQRDK